MKRLLLSVITVLVFSLGNSQSPEEMKAWQQSMMPGEQHQWLSQFDGKWVGEVKMWMDPSQPPSVSKMKTINEMVMNGLFQKSTHTGMMMGMEFNGEGLVGFDNVKKVFNSTWIDNMTSSISVMNGTLSNDNKTLTMNGTMTDAMTGKDLDIKQVLTLLDKDKHIFEMFMVMDGKEIKTMEITYTR